MTSASLAGSSLPGRSVSVNPMDGWWDCEALDEMCCHAIRAGLRSVSHFDSPTSEDYSLRFSPIREDKTARLTTLTLCWRGCYGTDSFVTIEICVRKISLRSGSL